MVNSMGSYGVCLHWYIVLYAALNDFQMQMQILTLVWCHAQNSILPMSKPKRFIGSLF